jgi:hypothetical protein
VFKRRVALPLLALWRMARRFTVRDRGGRSIPKFRPAMQRVCRLDENEPIIRPPRHRREMTVAELYEYYKWLGRLREFFTMFSP